MHTIRKYMNLKYDRIEMMNRVQTLKMQLCRDRAIAIHTRKDTWMVN